MFSQALGMLSTNLDSVEIRYLILMLFIRLHYQLPTKVSHIGCCYSCYVEFIAFLFISYWSKPWVRISFQVLDMLSTNLNTMGIRYLILMLFIRLHYQFPTKVSHIGWCDSCNVEFLAFLLRSYWSKPWVRMSFQVLDMLSTNLNTMGIRYLILMLFLRFDTPPIILLISYISHLSLLIVNAIM